MDKHEILARLGHLNDLAVELEVKSRRLINLLLDELETDVVDSDDEPVV
jgi:hypothetical protein